MSSITYDRVIDTAQQLFGSLWRRASAPRAPQADGTQTAASAPASEKTQAAPRRVRTRKALYLEAMRRYDNIVGRFDTLQRVPHRELLPPGDEEDARDLKENGAIQREDGQWIVPEHIELDARFEDFYPEAPADLRDRTPRLLMTRNNRSVASYVLPEDRAKGGDSTATALMYAGIVATAGVSFFAASIWAPLGVLAMCLCIPFVVALAQSEGPMEAAKAFFLLGLLPVALATGSSLMPSLGAAGGNPMMMAGGVMTLFMASLVVAFLFAILDKNAQDSIVGSTFQKFKAMVKWALVIGITYALVSLLPEPLQPFFYLAMPAFYPMVYTNANFMRRAKLLKEHGELVNIGRMGALTSAHVEPKKQQVINAFNDKSPLLVIGKAEGHLTKKHYPYGPDAGVDMVISAHDASKHVLGFGETGIGKSTCMGRPIAKQWIGQACGGFLCLDGKGALPGELSSLIQYRIKPGVAFAPFMGLDGVGLAAALNSTAKANGGGSPHHQVWEQGADDVILRCGVLFDALHMHELRYKQHASDMARLKELDIDASLVEIAQLEQQGMDTSAAKDALERHRIEHDSWASIRDADRKWLKTVDGMVKVLNMVNAPVKGPNGWEPGPLLAEAVKFLGLESDPARQARRKAMQPATVHPELGTQGLLDDALTFVCQTWLSYEPQQRSSFFLNVAQRILPLTSDPYLVDEQGRHWKTLETGIDARACLTGGTVGVELPEERHQRAGVLISALVKQGVYNAVGLRGGNPKWRDEGGKPFLLMIDEAQDLVSDGERQLLPKARSLGMAAVMLTQNWEGLQAKLGGEMQTLQFCNTFQNYILMRSSPKTYEFIQSKLGTAQMLTYEQEVVGLDMHGAVVALQASPLNDLDHPNRAAMRQIERQGAGKLVVQRVQRGPNGNRWLGQAMTNIDDEHITKGIPVPQTGRLKIQPVFLPEEYSALLTFGKAIVVLNRAGERRVDLATLNPVKEDELRKPEPALAA